MNLSISRIRAFQWGLISAVVALIFLFPPKGMTQSSVLEIEHYGVAQGLSHRNVRCIIKDHNQFLWVGTQFGLNRFDGKEFQQYLPDAKNPYSIAGLDVINLLQATDRIIWCCLQDGMIDAYHPDSGNFHHFTLPNTPDGQRPQIILITEFSNGDILVGTKQGHIYRKSVTRSTFNYILSVSQSRQTGRALAWDELIMLITETDDGMAWIVTKSGQWRWDFGDRDAGLERIDTKFNRYQYEYVIPTPEKTWLIGSIYHLEERDGKGHLIRRIHRPKQVHAQFNLDEQNKNSTGYHLDPGSHSIWVPFFKGLKLLSLEIDSVELSTTEIDFGQFLKPEFNFAIASYLADKGGLVWMASNDGLFCIKRSSLAFGTEKTIEDSLLKNLDFSVRGITKDANGKLWVAADPKGLFELDTKNKKSIQHSKAPGQQGKLQDNTIWATHVDHNNNLWIGGDRLYLRDEVRQYFIPLNEILEQAAPIRLGIHVLASDHQNGLWIGANPGLFRFDLATKTFEVISKAFKVNALFPDKDGSLLIGTEANGLVRFHPNSKKWDFPWLNCGHVKDIRSILRDRAGRLWLGTGGGGLIQLRFTKAGDWRSEPIFDQFSTKDGLPDNVVYGIQEAGTKGDPSGNLWLSTNYGLSRFNPAKKTCINYTEKHGLPGNEFNTQSSFKDENGRIYLGGLFGFTSFLPSKVSRPEPDQSVQITRVLIDQKQLDFANPIPTGTAVELAYDHNNLSFEFVAPHFQEPSKIKYAYRIDGLDDQWQYLKNENSINFVRIPPGSYTFRVKASNREGQWGGKEAKISFLVHQAWWKTPLAIVLYILIGGVLIGVAWRFQLNRIRMGNELVNRKKEALQLKELNEYKSQFFTNITHEFRTPLMLILGPIDYLKTQQGNPQGKEMVSMLERNSERLLKLINHLLDLASSDAKKLQLNLEEGNIAGFVKAQLAQFSSLAEEKHIKLSFAGSIPFQTMSFDHEKMAIILANVIGNALKYTPAGGTVDVSISFQAVQKTILVSIADSGCGIPRDQLPKLFDRFYRVDSPEVHAQPGTGLGLALVNELVVLHQGEVKVESEVGKGTQVDIVLPYISTDTQGRENPLHIQPATTGNSTVQAAPKADFLSLQGPNAEKLLILLIEDNEDVRQYIRFHLGPVYRLLEAEDGETGLNMASTHVPDLIISDVMMPGINGFEVARRLKLAESTSHIPLILLTAKSGLNNKLEGLETGADNYIEKPFLMRELHVRIRNLIQIRQNLHQHYAAQAKPQPAPDPALVSKEEKFLIRIRELVESQLDREKYSVEELASDALISRGQLHRKLKALTGMSPSVFMRAVRLERAHLLLTHQAATVSEIAWQVGFSSHAYFTKCFTDHFSYPPSAVLRHS